MARKERSVCEFPCCPFHQMRAYMVDDNSIWMGAGLLCI